MAVHVVSFETQQRLAYVDPVEIQFSRSGTTGWRTIRTIDISRNWSDSAGIFFQESLTEASSGYWRVVYPGDADYFQSAVSEAVHVP